MDLDLLIMELEEEEEEDDELLMATAAFVCEKTKKRKHSIWVDDVLQEREIFGAYHHLVSRYMANPKNSSDISGL